MFERGNPFRIHFRKSSFLFVAACLLAFGLILSSVIVALPMAVAQQPPASQEQGRQTEDIVADDAAQVMTEKGDNKKFSVVEASIADIHEAIKSGDATCVDIVQQYIDRARAYNGVCTMLTTEDGAPVAPAFGRTIVGSPQVFPTETVDVDTILPDRDQYVGLPLDLGRMETTISDPEVQHQMGMRVGIPDVEQLNALETLNIRGERSVTCKGEYDAHPSTGPLPAGAPEVCEEFRQQPDALERAAELDAQYGSNPPLDELPMYCATVAAKDPYDTKDMRTTVNNDVNFAMDVPPFDSTVIAQLREKGAIIYAKAQAHEFNAGPGNPGGPNQAETNLVGSGYGISTWAGQSCNPYDTERVPRGSSSGSGVSVAANLVTVAICEQTANSCQGPASRNGLALILTTKGLVPDSGGIGNQRYIDRAGIIAKTLEDGAIVLDSIKDPDTGYFDTRDIHTAIPKPLVSDDPYVSFVLDDSDIEENEKPLDGVRLALLREHFVTPSPNHVAMSNQIDNEAKTILRDKLGAELVETITPDYPDDPDVPNLEYTFSDAFSEIFPRYMPEIFSRTDDEGNLLFAVPGWNVTSYEYLLALSNRQAPISEDIKVTELAGIADFPDELSFKFEMDRYLEQRGDERITDWAAWVENAKFRQDSSRAGAENWVLTNTTISEAKWGELALSDLARLATMKVIYENDIDAFVYPENTVPPNKIGGPLVGSGSLGGITPFQQIPQIVVPAGFNQIIYEPVFELNSAKTNYVSVIPPGTNQTLMRNPMPVTILFFAGQGEEPTLLKIASAYEAATHHRAPPPDFGPVPDNGGGSFPIEHMPAPTASAGYGVYSQKPARVEYVTEDSELVGDQIDSITLNMKRVGTINGTAEIGVLNEDLSVKKVFGTLDVSTLTSTYTDYEFKLADGDELYTIEAGDRIGIKYEGGSLESTSWISVMLDLEPEDPFDGANSYLQYHYQGAWRNSPDRDLYMVLAQTTEDGDGGGPPPPPPPEPITFTAQLTGDEEVPPSGSDATGSAAFTLDGDSMEYTLSVTSIYNVTAAHIHLAPAGVNGPVVVPLFSGSPTGLVDGVLAEGTITADDLSGPLAGMTLDDLVAEMESGNTYTNVHTSAFPGGEIRGQISS
jgi:Asp-tRNA(Asn)/Glu-tRNA(Gln) amidotransferase A subunit family amidase